MNSVYPIVAALIAVSLYGILPPIAKKVGLTVPHFAYISITMFILSMVSAAASFLFEKHFSFKMLNQAEWAWLILVGFISFAAFSTYMYALSHIQVTEYQLLMMISPIVGAFFSYILLAEQFHARYFYGLLLIAAGLFIALKPQSSFVAG